MCNFWNFGPWPTKLVVKQSAKAHGPLANFQSDFLCIRLACPGNVGKYIIIVLSLPFPVLGEFDNECHLYVHAVVALTVLFGPTFALVGVQSCKWGREKVGNAQSKCPSQDSTPDNTTTCLSPKFKHCCATRGVVIP